MTTDETNYKLFKAIEDRPSTSQRELAAELEISLGKLNYCLKALLKQGPCQGRELSSRAPTDQGISTN
jgi:predicted transcriptional regulator